MCVCVCVCVPQCKYTVRVNMHMHDVALTYMHINVCIQYDFVHTYYTVHKVLYTWYIRIKTLQTFQVRKERWRNTSLRYLVRKRTR